VVRDSLVWVSLDPAPGAEVPKTLPLFPEQNIVQPSDGLGLGSERQWEATLRLSVTRGSTSVAMWL
jgi:hypothetical protein